ncbi:hypothetical protein [Photobacterium sanguinicancri]|uniref:hypothetical protein n=1 Tax=Photobacterium sanguinicancri TaxID=875932 RepID=UPI003D0F97BF
MIKSWVASVKKSFEQRLTNPVLGAFSISWVLINWKVIMFLLSSNKDIELKITYVEENYFDVNHIVIYPILSTVFITIIIPWISYIVQSLQEYVNKKRTIKQYLYDTEVLKARENLVRAQSKEDQIRLSHELNIEFERKRHELQLEQERVQLQHEQAKENKNIEFDFQERTQRHQFEMEREQRDRDIDLEERRQRHQFEMDREKRDRDADLEERKRSYERELEERNRHESLELEERKTRMAFDMEMEKRKMENEFEERKQERNMHFEREKLRA